MSHHNDPSARSSPTSARGLGFLIDAQDLLRLLFGGVISDAEFVEAHFHRRIGDIDLFGEQACIRLLPRSDTNWNLVPVAF